MPDHIAKRFIQEIQKKSAEILKLYADNGEEKKTEIEILAGQKDINWSTENSVGLKLTLGNC